MNIEQAKQLLLDNYNGEGESFVFFLNEKSLFRPEKFREYYESIIAFAESEEDKSPEIAKLVSRSYQAILRFIISHLDPKDSYVITDFPDNYFDYLEEIEYAQAVYYNGKPKKAVLPSEPVEPEAEYFLNTDSYEAWKEQLEEEAKKKAAPVIRSIDDDLEDLKAGDEIKFGSVRGNKLCWKVLKVEDSRALIIAKNCLRNLPFQMAANGSTWRESPLRKWLNNNFLKDYFSAKERTRIISSSVNTDDSLDISSGLGITVDKLFLLSLNEAKTLFADDQARACGYQWWLRSPGAVAGRMSGVTDRGIITTQGYFALQPCGVRPALWLSLTRKASETGKEAGTSNARLPGAVPNNSKPKTRTKAVKYKVGDTVTFGKGNKNTWKILKLSAEGALVINNEIICTKPFDRNNGETTWNDCSLRSWLNKNYLAENFNPQDINKIIPIMLDDFTTDKVFLLSNDEAMNLFPYAAERAVGSWWWLRSMRSGFISGYAAIVRINGNIDTHGNHVKSPGGVRPAMWINLDS